MLNIHKFLINLILFSFLFSGSLGAKTPEDLEKWKDWTLFENEKYLCPSSSDNEDSLFCKWPGVLKLTIFKNKIEFHQEFTLFKDSYLKLPGSRHNFPSSVKSNGEKIPVTLREGSPVVFPGTGKFLIQGVIAFEELPDFINIPDSTAGIDIVLESYFKKPPFRDKTGKLWLKTEFHKNIKKEEKSHLRVDIFRKIKDSIPCEIDTLIRINASGETRQEKIFPGNIPGNIASIDSPLPLRMNKDNSITIQVKPGTWNLMIKNIIPKAPNQIGPFKTIYGEEIIVHENSPGIRFTRWENLNAIDPSRTSIPSAWKNFPAYSVSPEKEIKISESVRGKGKETENLKLKREIWIDFDGRGATIEDEITGRLPKRSFTGIHDKEMIIPGKISINGKDRVISFKDHLTGLPLESGNINLKSVLRKNIRSSSFPTGWNKEFSEISGSVNIPPGWGLFYVSGGVLSGNQSFLSKWTLLDFFVLCILTIAAAKLWGFKWGGIFFLSAGALFHKFYLPPYIWIFMIIATAFLGNQKVREWLDKHRFLRFSFISTYSFLLILIFSLGIKFSYLNIRNSIYPQLENTSPSYTRTSAFDKKVNIHGGMQKEARMTDSFMAKGERPLRPRSKLYRTTTQDYGFTQTGTGIPSWSWKRIYFRSGSQKGLEVKLLPPFVTRAVFLINVILLWPLILKFIPVIRIYKNRNGFSFRNILPFLIFFIFAKSILSPLPGYTGEYPPDSLLKEYEKRLVKKKDCFPECVFVNDCIIKAVKDDGKIKLEMDLDINSQLESGFPLPESDNTIEIKEIELNGKKHDFLIRKNNKIFTLIPHGIHRLKIKAESIDKKVVLRFLKLPSRLKLHSGKGLETRGGNKNSFNGSLRIYIPEKKSDSEIKTYTKTIPFPVITREIFLKKEWKIRTTIKRFYSENLNKPLGVKLPLLKGEKILRERLDIRDNILELTLQPHVSYYSFESEIPVQNLINIDFPKNSRQHQKWIVNADPVWNFEIKNIGVSKIPETDLTSFVPQPGDNPQIIINKLKPYKGEFLSFDSVNMEYDMETTKNSLLFQAEVRASKGIIHPIGFEEKRLIPEKLFINNLNQPIVEKAGKIMIPISPGTNSIRLHFKEKLSHETRFLPGIISFPSIDTGFKAVNIHQVLKYDYKTWLIASFGPLLGPGVLFWGYLAAVVAAGFLLAGLPLDSSLKRYEWILFTAGLSLVSPPEIIIACSWFFIMEYRRNSPIASKTGFNFMQIGIVILTIVTISIIYNAVSSGLLGIPDMQVKGNSSWHTNLNWFTDKSNGILPTPSIITAPILIWRIILFFWSIWIASMLINRIPGAIEAFRTGGIWKKIEWKKNKKSKE